MWELFDTVEVLISVSNRKHKVPPACTRGLSD